jgi:hypothetical protein
MSGYLRPTNYVEDPEEIIRQARAKLRKKTPNHFVRRRPAKKKFDTSVRSHGQQDSPWILRSNHYQYQDWTNSQCGRRRIRAQASLDQHGASQPVLWKSTWRCRCPSPTLSRDLQHLHHQRSSKRCHTTPPFPILTLGKGEAMVLHQ